MFKKYNFLWTKVKQVFVQKISNLLITQTDQILIFSFTNLQTVAFFGNYTLLIGKLGSLIDTLFAGTSGSVGNLIAENNKSNTLKVFWELTSFRYFLNGIMFCFLFFCIEPIIELWLEEKYLIEPFTFYLLLINFFILQSRISVDLFKDAYGLFQDTWASASESIINLILSLVLGYYIGINGILIGTLISTLLIKVLWKPYFLFKKGFQLPVYEYWKRILIYYLGLILMMILISVFQNNFKVIFLGKLISTLLYCLSIVISSTIFQFIFLYSLDNGFRLISKRFYKSIYDKLKNN
jgi:O-antigen/teichoic acid export membrane protein